MSQLTPGAPLPTFESFVAERSGVTIQDPSQKLHMALLNDLGRVSKEDFGTKETILAKISKLQSPTLQARAQQIADMGRGSTLDIPMPHGDRYRFYAPL